MQWILPTPIPDSLAADLGRALSVPTFAANLLIRRGFADLDTAGRFIDPRLKTLRDPLLLPDMAAAVARTLHAIDRQQRIVLYGDYDVDGVTSLAILTRVLRAYGVEPGRFLPHRIDEGYGLSADGAARCIEEHQPQLLITVDCGTTAVVEIAKLQASGVDVIVIDHHESSETLPACSALVNPKRGTTDHHLCSAGLAFKFAHALLKTRPVSGFDLREVLDLVALGTVADLVPLLDENRILVRHGLTRLANSRWTGIHALLRVSGINPPLAASHVAFGLGPRLNAAGRLGTALHALELLLTEDTVRAEALAKSLDEQNRERRGLEDRAFQEAEAQLSTWFSPDQHSAIVVGSPDWHPGVVGIVASRVLRRYHRPTIVVGFDQEGLGKGSGRSIEGLCLVTALSRCAGHLLKYGGHAMAAGLSVQQACFADFRDTFLSVARETLSEAHLQPRLELDAELSLRDIDGSFLPALSSLEPFGIGHRAPLFYTRRVYPAAEPRVLKEKHLSLLVTHEGRQRRAMWFGAAAAPLPEPPWDIAYEVTRNEYQGVISPQIHVVDLRPSGAQMGSLFTSRIKNSSSNL